MALVAVVSLVAVAAAVVTVAQGGEQGGWNVMVGRRELRVASRYLSICRPGVSRGWGSVLSVDQNKYINAKVFQTRGSRRHVHVHVLGRVVDAAIWRELWGLGALSWAP